MPPADDTRTPVVHDAIGPDLPIGEAAAAIAMGVIALLMAGVQAALLGQLADEGRISASGIGLTATCEALAMGLTTAAAGILIPPRHLKITGAAAALVLALANLLTLGAHGQGVLAIRTAAGIPEGVMLWITVAMIARTVTPERWAGTFFVALTAGQLVLSLILQHWVLPEYGADGGFGGVAIASLLGVVIAFFLPARYAPLPGAENESGAPPPRGWLALLATLIYAGAIAAVGIYIQPLAHEAGLSADVARSAISISLFAQIFGGAAATAAAGHVRYFAVFVASFAFIILSWAVLVDGPSAWAFIAANTVAGFVSVFYAPFFVPLAIEADPSRKAAVLSGSTQVLAGALGPFAASFVVADDNVRGSIALGIACLAIGLALIAILHFTSRRNGHTV